MPTRQDHSLVGFQIALSTFRFCVFITPVGIFVIEKCSPELWWMKIINLKKKIEPHVCAQRLACVCIYNEILFAQR